MADLHKTEVKSHEEAVISLYDDVAASVRMAREKIDHQYANGKKKNSDIAKLEQYDILNYADWELPETVRESVGLRSYIKTVPKPLSNQFADDQHDRIYDDIIISCIQDRTSPYKDEIVDCIISNYSSAANANSGIFADNILRIEKFYDAIESRSQGRIDGAAGTKRLKARIGEIKAEIDEKINTDYNAKTAAKMREIEVLESNIEIYKGIIAGNPVASENLFSSEQPAKPPEPDTHIDIFRALGESLSIICASVNCIFVRISAGLKAFFRKLGENLRQFSGFVSRSSELPVFWVSLIATIINGIFCYRLFGYIFADYSMVLMLVTAYVAIFAILPFPVSKHLLELSKKPNERATKAMLIFETFLALLATSYPAMAIMYRRIYGGDRQVQLFAAIVVGALPFLMSVIAGFMNYRRLKNDSPDIQGEASESEKKAPPEVTGAQKEAGGSL